MMPTISFPYSVYQDHSKRPAFSVDPKRSKDSRKKPRSRIRAKATRSQSGPSTLFMKLCMREIECSMYGRGNSWIAPTISRELTQPNKAYQVKWIIQSGNADVTASRFGRNVASAPGRVKVRVFFQRQRRRLDRGGGSPSCEAPKCPPSVPRLLWLLLSRQMATKCQQPTGRRRPAHPWSGLQRLKNPGWPHPGLEGC